MYMYIAKVCEREIEIDKESEREKERENNCLHIFS